MVDFSQHISATIVLVCVGDGMSVSGTGAVLTKVKVLKWLCDILMLKKE